MSALVRDSRLRAANHTGGDATPGAICAGNAHFLDADLASLCKTQGQEAAWTTAFARFGTAAPSHVRGDFAVAVRDAAGRTLLAVDRFAIRTLCYRVEGNELRYAERADDLGGVAPELDPQGIFDYLYFRKVHPDSVPVADSSIVAYYHDHPLEFTAPATAKPRVILFAFRQADGPDGREKARQRAIAARERIVKGEDFATLAKELSDDKQSGEQGGSIGQVTKGSLLKELADVVFTLPIGQLSDVVEVKNAFHLIRVDEREDEHLRSLGDCRGEIQTVLGEPIADSLAYRSAARVADAASSGASFDSLASAAGGAKRSEPIKAGEDLAGLGAFDSVASVIGDLPDGGVTPEPVSLGGGYLVARRVEEIPPAPAPFEQVKQRVLFDSQTAKRRAVADSIDQGIRGAIARGSDVEPLFDGLGGMRVTHPFGRSGPIAEFARDQAVAEDSALLRRIFASRPGKALAPVKSAMGTIYIIVDSVTTPPPSDFARRRDQVWREIVDQRIEAWTARLRSRAQVTLYRKDLKSLLAAG